MVLLHIVSSGILMVEPTQRNRSGRQEVDRTSVGIVAGGGSEAVKGMIESVCHLFITNNTFSITIDD